MNTLRLNGHRLGFVARFALMLAACAAVSPALADEEESTEANLPPVPYLEPVHNDKGAVTGFVQRTCAEYTLISQTAYTSLVLNKDGWYVVKAAPHPTFPAVNVTQPIEVTSTNAHVIICDKTTLSCKSIHVKKSHKVAFYAQSTNETEVGAIHAKADEEYVAAIGGRDGEDSGEIEINGCKVTAIGGEKAAGIGGGKKGNTSSTVINGGFVTATGGKEGAGIGTGLYAPDQILFRTTLTLGFVVTVRRNDGSIEINGGRVEAKGSGGAAAIGGGYDSGCPAVTINGGNVQANANGGGAGIGTGGFNAAGYVDGYITSIVINGGTVVADAGEKDTNDDGAGIGSGRQTLVTGIVINGGDVTARGGLDGGSGIGSGLYGFVVGIVITGGNVKASARKNGKGAGIGGGGVGNWLYTSLGAGIAITGGKVYAQGSDEGAGIGGGKARGDVKIEATMAISISGSADVVAQGGDYGAGIGGGNKGHGYYISISGPDAIVRATGGWNGGAGIGGGCEYDGEYISISGGKVIAVGGRGAAGIGGGKGGIGNEIEILGGDVTATGGSVNEKDGGAGIGGGYEKAGTAIMISGGTVVAQGGTSAAGIGGGKEGAGSNIEISGGDITATGGARGNDSEGGGAGIGGGYEKNGENIRITGGKITAKGCTAGAGVGGGREGMGKNITISGGELTAIGGSENKQSGGAGIGGGYENSGEEIQITAGKVSATGGGTAAGIGGGCHAAGKNIKISGGEVTAVGRGMGRGYWSGAGIGGGCSQCGEDIEISGGTVKASADAGGAGIGGGGLSRGYAKNIVISGGDVEATGGPHAAGIGSGDPDTRDEKIAADDVENILISGGTVKATGGLYAAGIGGSIRRNVKNIRISGGTVTAEGGEWAAGIGAATGCGTSTGCGVSEIKIDGGTVTAQGGPAASGIGAGYQSWIGNLIISDGFVRATGGKGGAGIGGGNLSTVHRLCISGGDVTAQGGPLAAGIGAGDNRAKAQNLIISGGLVRATGGEQGAGIGCGKDSSLFSLAISGGTVTATGGVNAAGIGTGFQGLLYALSFQGGRVTAVGGSNASGIGYGERTSAVAAIGESIHFIGGTVKARAQTAGKPDVAGMAAKSIRIVGGSIDALQIKDEPTNGSGQSLCKVVFTNVVEVPPVTVTGLPANYFTQDLYPDEKGNLYLWLPETKGTMPTVVTVGTKKYRYIARGNTTVAQALSDTVPVTVNGKAYTELVRATDGCAFANGVLTIYGGKPNYALVGSMTNSEVRVEVAASATVTLDNLWLESYAPSNSLIKVAKGATLTLKLKGQNALLAHPDRYALTASNSCCGIEVPEGATLKIDSAVTGDAERSLFVAPSGYAAGIGGKCGMRNGNIEILGGTVDVLMGQEKTDVFGCGAGAGIGAGAYANNGPIAIRGGAVRVERSEGTKGLELAQTGAGIGSGGVPDGGIPDGRAAGEISVFGGAVVCADAGKGAGIGSGARNARVDVKISPAAFVTASADWGAGIGAGALAQGVSVSVAKLAGEAEGASVGLVATTASGMAAGLGSGALASSNVTFSVKIAGGLVIARGLCATNITSAVAIGYGSKEQRDDAFRIEIADGTVAADSIGRNDGREEFADVVITGGSVLATIVNGAERPQNAVDGKGEVVWPITVEGGWEDGKSITVKGQWTNDWGTATGEFSSKIDRSNLLVVNGMICPWGVDGEYAFTTTGDGRVATFRWTADVDGAPARALRKKAVIVTVDGEETDWTEYSTIPARETKLTGKVTWSAKNLPKGFKIDSKTGVISGYPKQPGAYVVRVTAKSGSQSETYDLKIDVGNLIDEVLPLEDAYELYAGVKTLIELGDSFAGAKATGLPTGLKFAAKDTEDKNFDEIAAGTVYGVPSAACTNCVIFTKKDAVSTHTASTWFHVAAAPVWSVGTFNGTVGNNGGTATLTVSANGKISGKIVSGGTTWAFSSFGYDSVEEVEDGEEEETVEARTLDATATSGKQTASVELVVTAKGVQGKISGDDIEADLKLSRAASKSEISTARLKEFAGLYTVQLACAETGYGYLSLTLDAKGTCRATGKLPDGTSASVTLPVVWDEEANAPVAVWYASPSAYKGGYVCGSLAWTRTPSASPVVTGDDIVWISCAPAATAVYGWGFERALTANGAYYDKLATLADYYDTLRFAADAPVLDATVRDTFIDEEKGAKTTVSRQEAIAAAELACWSALTVSLDEKTGKSFVVDQKATMPVRNSETKEWTYAGENDAALTLSFTKATGIFRGSFTCWYDYVSATDSTKDPVKETTVHTSKRVSYEGVMVLGESLRGFYLWNRTGAYEDEKTGKEKTFRYKESHPVVFEISE